MVFLTPLMHPDAPYAAHAMLNARIAAYMSQWEPGPCALSEDTRPIWMGFLREFQQVYGRMPASNTDVCYAEMTLYNFVRATVVGFA